MSSDDDTCKSLINAMGLVFENCGINCTVPSDKIDHYESIEAFNLQAAEVWNRIQSNARSMFTKYANIAYILLCQAL